MRTAKALAALTLAFSLTLSACGGEAGAPDKAATLSTTEHNDADIAFATGMIPHHAQALSMADMTRGRTLEPEASALVEDILAAQAPEIETMAGWLTDWDQEVPQTMRDHANAGHDDTDSAEQMQGMDDAAGMMTAEEMTTLENASDGEFQSMWLTMMIEHHQGAITMAETEVGAGQFKPAVELAEAIIAAQEQEIDAMTGLLP